MKAPGLHRLCISSSCFAALALLLALPLSHAQQPDSAPEIDSPPAIDLPDDGAAEGEQELPGVEPEPAPPTDDILEPKDSDLSARKSTGPSAQETERVRKKGWEDIVVLPRKPFLKRGRVEITPFVGTTINDTMIQHTALGVDLNYFLTEVFGIGVQGLYFFDNVQNDEFLLRYHFERVATINRYRYSVSGNFSYAPIYGKFSILDKIIAHYDVWISGGVGMTSSEVVPRDFNHESFSNISLTFPIAIGARFFITRWMAFQVHLRDYMMLDTFEAPGRNLPDGDRAKEEQSETRFINNLVFSAGLSFYLPLGFEYSTYR